MIDFSAMDTNKLLEELRKKLTRLEALESAFFLLSLVPKGPLPRLVSEERKLMRKLRHGQLKPEQLKLMQKHFPERFKKRLTSEQLKPKRFKKQKG
jgi:hypothetical protein